MLKGTQTQGAVRRAQWGDTVLAESAHTQRVDGYEYFPPHAVRWDLLEKSAATSVCFWKGQATYFDAVVGSERLPQAAWTYADPSPAANHIRGHVAFWRRVRVVAGDHAVDGF